MPFLDELSAIGGDPAAQTNLLRTWLATRPRELFDELRPARPILALPGLVVVTRYPDVLEVLSRDREFGVAAYAPKMHRAAGDFFLGMEDGSVYEREVSIMRLASSRDDLPRLEQAIGEWADTFVAEKATTCRLDVVSDVARRVPGRLVADYFGASGPDEATRLRWMRDLFHDAFLNPGDRDPAVRDQALRVAAELSAWLDERIADCIARAQAGEALPDTVLARCVRMQGAPETALDAVGIRRNIAGLIVGTIDTTSEAIANAFDFLLDRPDLLAQAAAAARDGTLDEVRGFVFEALRFNPQAPFLPRLALAPAVLARGTERETAVPAGSVVIAALMSAMSDAAEIDAPETFNPLRPSRHYLHFGHGLHQCFGRHINRLQLPLIARAVLRLPGLRRAPGEEGQVKFDGPFADRLLVEFDPAG
jgi:cytochrome P450